MNTNRERGEAKEGLVVVCDGMRTGEVGYIAGAGSTRHVIKLLINGLEVYEPDYSLLHVSKDNQRAVELLVSHYRRLTQALKDAREEEADRIWNALLDAILLDSGEFKIFTESQWKWLKKQLHPLTHTPPDNQPK